MTWLRLSALGLGIVWVVACAGRRERPAVSTLEVTNAAEITKRLALPPGTTTHAVRARCQGFCAKVHLTVFLEFEGATRPPLSLELRDGESVVARRKLEDPCSESDVAHDEPPVTCTVLLGHGWMRFRVPDAAARDFTLVIRNDGAARDATFGLSLLDEPVK